MAPAEVGPPAEPARLLHADEERLRLAAATLARGGRFVVTVAENRLWPIALELLRQRLPDHRFVEHAPTTSDEANQAISDPLRDQPRLEIVIRISGQDAGPIEALNLRRESLSRATANFIIVLDGEQAHNRFLREAPDCYSYRDLLVVLEGEPELGERVQIRPDEYEIVNSAIQRAKQDLDPRERAAWLCVLAWQVDGPAQFRKVIDEAIDVLHERESELLEGDRVLLADLYCASTFGRSRVEMYKCFRKALEILTPVADQHAEQLAHIEAQMVGAVGIELGSSLDAMRRARERRDRSLGRQLVFLAQAYCARDNIVRAREVIAEVNAAESAILGNSPAWIRLHFDLLVEQGAWADAEKLVASTARTASPHREQLGRLQAALLLRRGESGAAQRLYERLPADLDVELAMARIAADSGRLQDASTRIAQILQRPWASLPAGADDLLAVHRLLEYVTAQAIAAGSPTLAWDELDSRLAALLLYFAHTEGLDPPWASIDCLLLQADAYLKRPGEERSARSCAEQAWQLAHAGAPILEPRAARRCAVALLRLGEFAEARDWITGGIERAREHELRGDEVELRGLALWHATCAGGDAASAEAALQAAVAASGSALVEAAVLTRVGSALSRHDLLRRAQQIYRSLPWPAREGTCLEALGETQIAGSRYQTFGLATRAAILGRCSGRPPITAADDE